MSRATNLAGAAAARAAQSRHAKVKAPTGQRSDDIFGAYRPATAILASRDHPITMGIYNRVMQRVDEAFNNLATAADPGVNSWRDLADVLNYLQSSREMGLIVDEGEQIEATKAALQQGAESWQKQNYIHLTDESREQLRSCIEQFSGLALEQPAYDFWRVVRHTKQRIQAILKGNRAPGDIVIAL